MTESPQTSSGVLGRWGPLIIVGVALFAYFLITRPAGALDGWSTDFDAALASARQDNKNVVVAFHSQGCPPCVTMERYVLGEEPVASVLKDFVAVRVDAYERGDLGAKFGVMGTPTYVVMTPDGDVLGRTMGYVPMDEFIDFLSQAIRRTPSG